MFNLNLDNNQDRLQFQVEAANWRISHRNGKFGIPLILPHPTPFLLSRLEPTTREILGSLGAVPLLHLSQQSSATEELYRAIEKGGNIDSAVHGVQIKTYYNALLYEVRCGDCCLRLIFDAKNRGVNDAFRCWQKMGCIPTVITSPDRVGTVDFPFKATGCEWFMDKVAVAPSDSTLRKFLELYSSDEEFEKIVGKHLVDVVLGHSLDEIIPMYGPLLKAHMPLSIV